LLLAARKLSRVVPHAVGTAHDGKRGFHVLAALRFGELRQQEGQLHVLERGQHRNQVVHLEDESDMARAPIGEFARGHVRNFVTVDGNAARRRDVQAAE